MAERLQHLTPYRRWYLAGQLQGILAYLEAEGVPEHIAEILREIQVLLAVENLDAGPVDTNPKSDDIRSVP